MEEDTSEEVCFDLDQMDLIDLRLMARQNDLSDEGGRVALLSRIRESFGFDFDDQIQVTVESGSSKTRSENTKGLVEQDPVAKRAKKAPSLSTSTSATTGTSRAGTSTSATTGTSTAEDLSQRKRKQPLLDLNLEDKN